MAVVLVVTEPLFMVMAVRVLLRRGSMSVVDMVTGTGVIPTMLLLLLLLLLVFPFSFLPSLMPCQEPVNTRRGQGSVRQSVDLGVPLGSLLLSPSL